MSRKFIVGLGNPGAKYRWTRHNLGFLVVDAFARAHGFDRDRKKFNAKCTEQVLFDQHHVMLVKPLTYMNLSGDSVRDILAFYRIGLEEGKERDLVDSMLVVYDDLDLPSGRLRFRSRGSSGGHRGVASVVEEVGTDRFSRLRIGIGRGTEADDHEHKPAEDYVLEAVGGDERQEFERTVEAAAATLEEWIRSGVTACANRFNGDPGGNVRDADE